MIKINKSEVLRYLGHTGQIIDTDLNQLIDKVITELETVNYKYVYKKFDIKKDKTIKILNTTLELEGKSINNILKYSDEVIIFAATLGQSIDKRINSLKHHNVTEMMIVDACASEMIEAILNEMEKEIKRDVSGYLAPRFSPGYGDLSLENQKPIIKILDASKKIGLMANESYILLPKKSVTGIIGIQKEDKKLGYRACDDCLSRSHCDHTKCTKGVFDEV